MDEWVDNVTSPELWFGFSTKAKPDLLFRMGKSHLPFTSSTLTAVKNVNSEFQWQYSLLHFNSSPFWRIYTKETFGEYGTLFVRRFATRWREWRKKIKYLNKTIIRHLLAYPLWWANSLKFSTNSGVQHLVQVKQRYLENLYATDASELLNQRNPSCF